MTEASIEWNEAQRALLRQLWDEGHSTAEIGRRMHISKNTVCGKAHRMNLPSRPSPLKPAGSAPSRRTIARRVRHIQPTLNPLTSLATPHLVRPSPEPVVAAETAKCPPTSRTCCWPIGDPGTTSFRFCDDVHVLPGKPYCPEHCARAYVKSGASALAHGLAA